MMQVVLVIGFLTDSKPLVMKFVPVGFGKSFFSSSVELFRFGVTAISPSGAVGWLDGKAGHHHYQS